MEAVIDLIQRKKRLLVVKMLVEESLKNIDRESARILIKLYIDKIDLKSIAISCNINKRTMARRINKMLIECMDKISDLGYSCMDIERLLENEGWIIGIYNYHVNKVISKSSKSNGIKPIEMSKLYGLDKMLFSQYSETHSTA